MPFKSYKAIFKTISSTKIWSKVLCVIFPQVITCVCADAAPLKNKEVTKQLLLSNFFS